MTVFSGRRLSLLSSAFLYLLFVALLFPSPVRAEEGLATEKRPFLIDAHNHVIGQFPSPSEPITDYDGAARAALATMHRLSIKTMVIMPPPFPPGHPGIFDIRHLAELVKKYPGRFAFLGGGESLNVMIQKAVRGGGVPPTLKRKFREKALEILNMGAVGFGELTAEHLSFAPRHPYEWAPPDHPLFLLLADIAAEHDVPIYIHMEAVPKAMPLPAGLHSPPNPERLHANIAAFERLLNHNRNAKIVWVQAGWDHTGYRTVQLCRKLLTKHPNLFMTIKISPRDSPAKNRPVDDEGNIKPAWLKLFHAFPDRFLIGSDQFYLPPQASARIGPPSAEPTHNFFSQLPPALAREIGYKTPHTLLRLKD